MPQYILADGAFSFEGNERRRQPMRCRSEALEKASSSD